MSVENTHICAHDDTTSMQHNAVACVRLWRLTCRIPDQIVVIHSAGLAQDYIAQILRLQALKAVRIVNAAMGRANSKSVCANRATVFANAIFCSEIFRCEPIDAEIAS